NMIVEAIKKKKRELKMNSTTLVELSGVNKTSISLFLNRKGGLRIENIESILKALNLEIK
ncbi:MAG: helix-turn-helix domain-containing protein, partial [Phocaeicola sp.]